MQKRLLVPTRLRRVPPQFSWIDQRLVREGYIERCDPAALALYLFLVTVADARGLSFYADRSIATRLGIEPACLSKARQTLIEAQLIAYQAPLYQVLDLATPAPSAGTTPSAGTPQSIGALLRRALEKKS